jgi:Zn-dependent metalloprotease
MAENFDTSCRSNVCEPNTGNDQCGVHSNSGVLNKWYYLMVEGSGQAISRFWNSFVEPVH